MNADLKFGSKKLKSNLLIKGMVKIAAKQISLWPIPGAEVLFAKGGKTGKKIRMATNPREANVILICHPLSPSLAKKAVITFAQVPRPRVLIFTEDFELSSLPAPDLIISAQALESSYEQINKKLYQAYFSPSEPFAPQQLEEMLSSDEEQEQNHQHHHEHEEKHEHEQQEEDDDQNHENHEHDEHDQHQHNDHEGHEHGGHDHGGGMGFMSMVAMTKDMPRSKDGLAMEHNPSWFGPFFPGLPGGLQVKIMLDGDSVMQAEVDTDIMQDHWLPVFSSKRSKLPEALAASNPLTPVCFKTLGESAINPPGEFEYPFLSIEKERILSHLNWLLSFSTLLGNQWLHDQAKYFHYLVQENNYNTRAFEKIIAKIDRMHYLRKRLQRIGMLEEKQLKDISGPVAKAAGFANDSRNKIALYQNFEPVAFNENNAYGRLRVRLQEINQSMHLLESYKEKTSTEADKYEQEITLESPRGTMKLIIDFDGEDISGFDLTTSSQMLVPLIPKACQGLEIADALLVIASLDLNPWELGIKQENNE